MDFLPDWLPQRPLRYVLVFVIGPWLAFCAITAGSNERLVQSLEVARVNSLAPLQKRAKTTRPVPVDTHGAENAELAEREARATRDAALIAGVALPVVVIGGIVATSYAIDLVRRRRAPARRRRSGGGGGRNGR